MSNRYFTHGKSLAQLELSRCKTAWMGGIPKNTSKADIMDFFKDYNPQCCKIIEKTPTNRFAFIYFKNDTDRNNAIAGKKNCLFKNQEVVINQSFNAYEGTWLGGDKKTRSYNFYDDSSDDSSSDY